MFRSPNFLKFTESGCKVHTSKGNMNFQYPIPGYPPTPTYVLYPSVNPVPYRFISRTAMSFHYFEIPSCLGCAARDVISGL